MRTRLTYITLAMIIVLSSAALLQAQRAGGAGTQGPPPGGRSGRGEPGRTGGPPCAGQALANALGLTADQRVTFDQITKDAQTRAKPLEDQLQQLRADARASGRGSEAAAADIAKATELQRQLTDIQATSRTSLKEILTAEQREQLHMLNAQTTGRGGSGAGRGGGRGGDGATGSGGTGRGPCGG